MNASLWPCRAGHRPKNLPRFNHRDGPPKHLMSTRDHYQKAGVNLDETQQPRGVTLACSLPFGYDSPAMEPADSTTSPLQYPLAPDAQTACYSPWLKVRVLIRFALTTP